MRRYSFQFLTVLAWLLSWGLGCGKVREAPQVGTNTNWLKTCGRNAECGKANRCLCGICTRTCSADLQCGALHAETRCQELSESACGAGVAESSACLQDCRSNRDCTSLEHGQCVAGLCVPADDVEVEPDADSDEDEPDAGTTAVEREAGMSTSQVDYTLTSQDNVIAISDAYTACETRDDCMGIKTSCDGCCQVGAISKGLELTYYEHLVPACNISSFIRTPTCDCEMPDRVVSCEEGRCRTRPRTVLGCYSPTQDPEAASHAEAVGCVCDSPEASICTGSIAMYCGQSWTGHFAWFAVDDPSCVPRADDTCTGERRATVAACAAEFRNCHALTSGEYCGLP